ncbi:MAG TPA: RDD family protein [Conexibacter sp.]|jgi:CheY-like chemotaxis protein
MTGEAMLRAQAAASARLNGGTTVERDPARPRYAGLATRVVAFALDAAVVNAAAIVVAAIVTLCVSLLSLPNELKNVLAVIGGAAWLVWSVGYFAVFWSTTGQTPGDRVMRISVRDVDNEELPIAPLRAVVRFVGIWLGAIPLFAGYVPILLEERRRAFHDHLASSVVVYGEAARERPADPAPSEVGVMTVDDQASFRSAARAVVRATTGFYMLAEAASAKEALAAADTLAPQLVLMDVRMPETGGVEATRQLLARRPGTVVVLVSAGTLDRLPPDAERCGAAAVLAKQDFGPRTLTELWQRHGS